MKVNRKQIWLVEWQDAHSRGGWHTDKLVRDFIDEERCVCAHVGWILSETDDELVLASGMLKWRPDDSRPEWSELQKIPKAWIRKKIIYKEKKHGA